MSDVRVLESAEEFNRYRELVRYCFSDEFSQSAPIFSFIGNEDRGYGLFEQDRLETGIISRDFRANLWGQAIKLHGITYVASAPEARNKGHVRTLMNRILQDAYEAGYHASALYPFLFNFYAKFGYGTLGALHSYRFTPEDIQPDLISQVAGTFEPLISGREELDKPDMIDLFSQRFAEAQQVYNGWAENYSLGIELPLTAEQQRRYLGSQNEQAYLYRNLEGQAVGYLQYKMRPVGEDNVRIEVQRFAYLTAEGFRGLMSFLARHRNQCLEVVLRTSRDVPVHLLMEEPRIKLAAESTWMARPLKVKELLIMRIKQTGYSGTLRFSLQDPVIDENTATYTINSGELSIGAFTGENEISFESFSSLLFGAYSWQELALAGRVPSVETGLLTPKAEEEFSSLFRTGAAVMLSENF
ncbi:MAG: GNAT family N-acetyltransferase [Spirochaetaceae bacterium]|nr:GNAT family N-acetyltransferase [Spirochaetaceae bacterium]MCF7949815.1 GNAT family N-acetyltransferase [Spirochaetia bacterium]MCF7951992.1 GNAT family N-acetyltransferase [Spirochaetaceae bacterium]